MHTPLLARALCLSLLAAPTTALAQRDATVAEALDRISPQRIEHDIRKLESFGTRHALATTRQRDRGVIAAGQWIHDELEAAAKASAGRMTVRFDPFDPREYARGDRAALQRLGVKEIRNVIAELKGKEPGRVIIVSGHYDSRASRRYDTESRAPGANDDASGTAAVLELARALAPVKTRASIWFATVTAEELGLWGSRHLAQTCDEQQIGVEAMITNDIIGGAKDAGGKSEDDVVRVFSQGRPQITRNMPERARRHAMARSESDSPCRQLARYVAQAAETYVPAMKTRLIFRLDRFLRGGDHKPFTDLGYAAVRFTEPKENYTRQHQDVREEDGIRYGDLADHVDFAYVSRVARVNAATILSLALAPPPVDDAGIVIRSLSNSTTLTWKTTKDDTLKTYRILLRRTHEPTWTRHYDVGLTATAEVAESKDDWLFAVQAVDEHGHASLPTFALPARRRR